MSTRQTVVDALMAERYGPSLWWATPEPTDDPVADPEAAARRLAELLDAVGGET